MAKTAFVTGGTGFIGINLIELLVNEGWSVTALHRATSNLEYLNRFPVALEEGSITDRESLEQAIPQGADAVFHVAGDTSFWSRNNARQDTNNIGGTRNMVEVAAQKQVGAFIHTSSNAVWGRVRGTIDEETPAEGESSWINYERSKHLAELEALKGVELGMKVVVVNPSEVVGPYDTTSFGRLFFLLRDGKLPAASPGTLQVTHVHDVVRAHLDAVTKGRSGERYLLTGDEIDFPDFVRAIAHVSGAKAPMTAPAWLFKVVGRVSVMIAAITGKEPDVTPEIATSMSDTGRKFLCDKAIRELGYRTRPPEAAIQDNYDWLVKEGLLTGSPGVVPPQKG
ncbi:MAG: NAD-dependent epimerase/dehydratase family protein [Deltaproteobacteria bacterium]|nr:NAD-dependent epimerase/dehydratase family protein [Deltaproteobacteria bacterium]NND27847.1 NAD-dependent epimerase/dehydratase family protein [Myxococcales bacterium]MBT8465695.1 NAD-dependent epimerase/dehydratase family protein [Deltaproteobacteria bacterium]MBT8481419.1 NAD-dependent epimerase/dehydratase family protein [Deltaproteobacteria bacterium]NNK08121.1 NAD-dependent epimerase/dehydratase family protein [Myxococcales bacterium]